LKVEVYGNDLFHYKVYIIPQDKLIIEASFYFYRRKAFILWGVFIRNRSVKTEVNTKQEKIVLVGTREPKTQLGGPVEARCTRAEGLSGRTKVMKET
jgi:hypothetical protein